MSEGVAAVFRRPGEAFDLRSYPIPDPGEGEILIRIDRCDVCGSDLHMWRGDVDLSDYGVNWGVVLGHEMVGSVAALGRGIAADAGGTPLAEGARVVFSYHFPCGKCKVCSRGQTNACPAGPARMMTPVDSPPHFYGGFAQWYLLPKGATILAAPEDLSEELLTPLNCALVQVVFGLEEVGLRAGDSVVVQGCGGLGLFACAVAKEAGASPVIALDRIAERLRLAEAFGADEVIDASVVDEPRARVKEVMRLTEGWGADVVVEVAGVPEVVPEGIRMLARYGRYLEIGNISGRHTYKADPSLLVGANRRIFGVSFYRPETLGKALDFLARTKDHYPYARIASHVFPLEKIDDAFFSADALRGGTSVIRAAVRPWD